MRCCSPVVSASGASAVAHRTQVDLLQRHDSQLRCPHIIACCQLTPVAHATHGSRACRRHKKACMLSWRAQHGHQRAACRPLVHLTNGEIQRQSAAGPQRPSAETPDAARRPAGLIHTLSLRFARRRSHDGRGSHDTAWAWYDAACMLSMEVIRATANRYPMSSLALLDPHEMMIPSVAQSLRRTHACTPSNPARSPV